MVKRLKIILPVFAGLAAIFAVLVYKGLIFSGSRTTVTHFASPSADSLEGYYQKSQDLIKANSQNSSATFLAVGDIMLSRSVAANIKKPGDADMPFYGMAEILKSTDFNFGNLESPFAPTPASEVVGGSSLVFGAPAQNAKGLSDYNFKILNLANNHSFDQGLAGIDFTKKTLDRLGILHEGTGDNLDEAWQPAIVTANGIKICFIGASYSSINDNGKTTNGYVARIEDLKNLKSAIKNSQPFCDFIIATMHAGTEYTRTPNGGQIAFAHAAIDDGANMVIGAHPHWAQTVEKYGGKYIFYSLGNFVFDQAWSQDTKEGLTLKIQVSKSQTQNPITPGAANLDDLQGNRQQAKLDLVQLIPVIIENSQPRPANEQETKKILQKIGQTNAVLK